MLSGNRNFEGRISPDVKMNYLASPPLVVAYSIAGTMDIDILNDAIATDPDGKPVYLRDIWPSTAEVEEVLAGAVTQDMFTKDYADVFAGDERWQGLPTPDRQHLRVGPELDLRAQGPVLRRHEDRAVAGAGHLQRAGAGQAR